LWSEQQLLSSRILLVIPTLDRSGAEKQLTLLATGLPKRDFDVHVCTLTREGPLAKVLADAAIPIHSIGKRGKVDPFAFLRLTKLMRRLNPDLVHTWIFAANAYGRAAAIRAGVRRIVGGERCVDPWKNWWELAIDRRLAKRTDRIITNSSGVKDFYSRHGVDAKKFEVIPNGINSSRPTPATSKADWAAELGIPDTAQWVGAIGRLWSQKRLKDAIWTMDIIKVVRDDVYLLIVGDGPERAKLERFVWQIKIEDRVRFLGERSDVLDLLPHLSFTVLASGYEGQSNSIMESMVAGLPVVASDIPGNRDLVVEGETGYLFPVGDRGEFSRCWQRVLGDKDRSKLLGEQGAKRVREGFTTEKMISRHADLYLHLIHG
jgi:glycosyltransferase involved in cell wall biosynthesis